MMQANPDDLPDDPAPADQAFVEAAYKAAKEKCLEVCELTVAVFGKTWKAMIVDKKNVGHVLEGRVI